MYTARRTCTQPDAGQSLPSEFGHFALQNILQFIDSQKTTLFRLRRAYIINMAHVSRRRQQLLRQLQAVPEAVGINNDQLEASYRCIDDLTKGLQRCTAQEGEVFIDYQGSVAHEASLINPDTSPPFQGCNLYVDHSVVCTLWSILLLVLLMSVPVAPAATAPYA